jgi:hypothetical protein
MNLKIFGKFVRMLLKRNLLDENAIFILLKELIKQKNILCFKITLRSLITYKSPQKLTLFTINSLLSLAHQCKFNNGIETLNKYKVVFVHKDQQEKGNEVLSIDNQTTQTSSTGGSNSSNLGNRTTRRRTSSFS